MTQDALIAVSDDLHDRVQRFACGESNERFEQLALSVAEFQAQAAPGFRRLLAARGGRLASIDDIPPVPSDAFRLTRVATFPESLDSLRFFSSGTTGAERGLHCMRRRDTYEWLSLRFGAQALLPLGATTSGSARVLALAPTQAAPPSSSLGYMMARFMEAFDGELTGGRFLFSESGVDLAGLKNAVQGSAAERKPVLLLGTAFAYVNLLDQLAGQSLPLPAGSLAMQTGGFKGRTREVSMPELREQLAQALGLTSERVVGEYGMTELTSQLYEGTIRESALGRERPTAESGVYFEPPWLRVTPVDPGTLEPVPEGEVGLARFVDLGNVDSAVSVVTQDRVRRRGGGIELLGRQAGAPARGCSLAIEALLHG